MSYKYIIDEEQFKKIVKELYWAIIEGIKKGSKKSFKKENIAINNLAKLCIGRKFTDKELSDLF